MYNGRKIKVSATWLSGDELGRVEMIQMQRCLVSDPARWCCFCYCTVTSCGSMWELCRGNGQWERRWEIDSASPDISPFFFFFYTGARKSVSPWQDAHKRFLKNIPLPGAPWGLPPVCGPQLRRLPARCHDDTSVTSSLYAYIIS